MVTFEVEKGFSYLLTGEMCHRHPEGMIVENGMFSLMKDDIFGLGQKFVPIKKFNFLDIH